MTTPTREHRLVGLEPDNVLAFLALIGLLRALEAADGGRTEADRLLPRVAWDLAANPLRPVLHLACPATQAEVAEVAGDGLARLGRDYGFADRADLDFTGGQARELLADAARCATVHRRSRSDLLAALMSDGARKPSRGRDSEQIEPTPFCLQFGQGHQHFLTRLTLAMQESASQRQRGGRGTSVPPAPRDVLAQTLFSPWRREDAVPSSFRWDPEEDVRYALRAGDPTDDAYKSRTEHGANRLAAAGLAALTAVPVTRGDRVRLQVLGGRVGREGFSFAWPIWRHPATLASIRALLGHPGLFQPGALSHLGVEYVVVARRISVGKFMNFTRGSALVSEESAESAGVAS